MNIEPLTMQSSLSPTPSQEFWAGVKAELPLLIGVIPFGMIYGALAINARLPVAVAQSMSAIVFAGSAQFIATQLFGLATPALVIILTIAVVNLRHALYSASVGPYLKSLSPLWKAILAYLLTDEAYAVAITHLNADTPPVNKHWFFLGAGLGLWTSWQTSTAAGIFLGAVVPQTWSLDFTLALTFIALMVPAIKDRPALGSALSAGLTAVLTYSLPYKLWIILAAVVGILVGMVLEGKK